MLVEVQRSRLGDQDQSGPLQPSSLAGIAGEDIFVALAHGGSIHHLSAKGTWLGSMTLSGMPGLDRTPMHARGIGIDAQKRIWLSLNNHLCIFAYTKSGGDHLALERVMDLSLRSPFALCSVPGDRMLVADMGNSRLLFVTDNGDISIFYSRAGKRSKELSLPTGLCLDPLCPDGAIWVADYGNHRVAKISLTGEVVAEFGEPGIGGNCLLYPISVAVFGDGVVAVTQYQYARNIVLFSPEGEAMERLLVDYSPCGLLAHDETLIVTELDGSHFRIYERRKEIA